MGGNEALLVRHGFSYRKPLLQHGWLTKHHIRAMQVFFLLQKSASTEELLKPRSNHQ